MRTLLRRVLPYVLAAFVLTGTAPARAADPPPPQLPAPVPLPDAAIDRTAQSGSGVTLQRCGGSTYVQGRRGSANLDVTYVVDAKPADAVEFLFRNEYGPRYAFVLHDAGTFTPGTPIHHVFRVDAPNETSAFKSFANHCSVTAVHFTDGAQWRAPGTFMADEQPEVTGEFGLPPNSGPRGIALGADGSLWVAEETANKIAHVDAGNGKVIAEFAVPTANANPRFVARAENGVIWFSEFKGAKIGRIAADGTVREFPLPCTACHPAELAVDKAGNVWFAERNYDFDLSRPATSERYGPNVIGKMTPDGTVAEYLLPTKNSFPNALFVARDGTVWFTESSGKIGHMAPDGKLLVELQASDEHHAWIGEDDTGTIHLLSTDAKGTRVGYSTLQRTPEGGYRVVSLFSGLPGRIVPFSAALDRNGNIWFADFIGNRVARASADGRSAELNLGIGNVAIGTGPASIAAADDGSLWLVESLSDRIVHIRPR